MALNNFINKIKELPGKIKQAASSEKICSYFGDNENAAIVVAVTIAVFKGIFRPLFTMMDKKQDPDAKVYAAFREGLTELVAVPLYIAVPLLAGAIAKKKFAKTADNIMNAKEIANNVKNAKTIAKFIGVCITTLLIPAACNIIQPPIMDAFKKHQDSKKAKAGLDINLDNNAVIQNKPSAMDMYLMTRNSSGMRVGN